MARSKLEAGSVVWITGAGKGIGRALSVELAKRGMKIAASARTRSDLQSLVSQSTELAGSISSWPVDVTEREEMSKTASAIEAELGSIDLLVCNAGTHSPVTAVNFDADAFNQLLDINIMGVVNGIAPVLPRMTARSSGRIAVVSSVAGYRGLPSAPSYGATKAALINMCEALKPELEHSGVKLHLVCPGFVRTPLTDRNSFHMPFLMEPEDAARRIADGIQRNKFEITFPWRFVFWLKLGRILPYWAYFALTRRLAAAGR